MLKLSKPLILASNSPRRKELLTNAGFEFTVQVIPVDESFPSELALREVAGYISDMKAKEFGFANNSLVLTADTVVAAEGQILGKPANRQEAIDMLSMLSGKSHEVITAISISDEGSVTTYSDIAIVWVKNLDMAEIVYYVDQFKPFDKAGAYGIQEWLGMIAIDKIEGSFYTIMGLPIHLVYRELKRYSLE